MTDILRVCVLIAILSLLTACNAPAEEVITITPTVFSASLTPESSPSPTIIPTLTLAIEQIITTPTIIPAVQACSPLDGINLVEISDTIVNPYNPPRIGSDDPHQGVDFAYRLDGDSIALEGLPVAAVLDGQVAMVLDNRFPYGNAIMVETSLEDLSIDSIALLQIPTPAPKRDQHPALTCPTEHYPLKLNMGERSLYLLYAHLQDAAPNEQGDVIGCGQLLGVTGSSGNALNPHLHLEVRVGPAGVRFPSMAHYDTSATAEEMAAYCAWRVSSMFQLVDPMLLLEYLPSHNN